MTIIDPRPAPPRTRDWDLAVGAYRGISLGMTPDEVNGQLEAPLGTVTWEALPVAGEYQDVEVRYFWRKLREVPSLVPAAAALECLSSESYVTFLFSQGRLFRISLRLPAERGCVSHRPVLVNTARSVGAAADGVELVFRKATEGLVLAGLQVGGVDFLELARLDAPRFPGQAW